MALPPTVLAKPHCGLMARFSIGRKRAASSSRRRSTSGFSMVPCLVVTRPSTTFLSLGMSFKGMKSPERSSSYSSSMTSQASLGKIASAMRV